ncbi:capsular biosynthesis protein [Bacillus thuringiensis]|uniref:Capsular biosynthesis protein n=1 Tax=Bacillus thuringiensis TaxID=1428 RepID=A0ABD6S0X6_BACTU|nr:glycosyltransferase family 4 protein [Bacillus thuringiensis]PER50999.1 capsular biosynthesis protein [Bacillus thuringiensis]PEU86376.1 capsular biosynthesis protein [Bacillus thuringiensis]PFI13469.1 capsular biosynthesis protein [Bacillus thuringiensis]PFW19012.1 capsular biosynthesis protein [Bacillus thuringiensis]PGY84766.1 capsular biosynthesis protein [Bacillus thuringiensis]
MKNNLKLDKKKTFMFSSVHVWMDTRIFYKEAQTLAKEGYQVEFYAVDNGAPVIDIGVNVRLLAKKSKWHRPFHWYYLYKEALQSDALYYHFHDPELLLVAERLKKKKPHAIIIYDMHEDFPGQIKTKEWIPKWMRKPLSFLVRKKEKRAMRACDAVIFAENYYRSKHLDYGGMKQEVLNLPTWQPTNNDEKENKFTFIYVGDIVIDRNVFGMLDMVSELKKRGHHNFQLKLIGPISDQLQFKINKYIKKIGIDKQVIFYGRLPYSEIWTHYRSAHVGLCLLYPDPNYLHSLATKLYEYMAAGLPSIISDFPDWRTLMLETSSGLTVDPHNISEITNVAEQLINNSVLREKLGRSGRKSFENRYNWDSEAKKLIKLYHQLSNE